MSPCCDTVKKKNWNVWLDWKCSDNIEKIVRTVNDVKEGSPQKHQAVVGSPHHFLCSNGSTSGASWTFLMWHHWRSSLYTYISKYYNLGNFRKLLQNSRKNHYQDNFSQPFLFFCSNVHNSSESQSLILRFANQPNLRVGGVYGIALLLLLKEGN